MIIFMKNDKDGNPSDKIGKSSWLFDRVCAYCGRSLGIPIENNDKQISFWIEDYPHCDHLYPKSRGGSRSPDNLVLSCIECNIKKWKSTPEEANMLIRYGDCNLLRTGWF